MSAEPGAPGAQEASGPASPGWAVWMHAIRPVSELANLASHAEQLGAAAILVPDEGLDRDLYVTLAAMARSTERVTLMAAITNPFSRHPVTTAAAFASLAELAPGRIVAGYGTGGNLVLDPMGLRPKRPYTALVEAVSVAKALFEGSRVDQAGEFEVRGAALPWSRRRIPIAIAGRGPRVEEFAASTADWVLLAGRPIGSVPALVARLRARTDRPVPAKVAWDPGIAWTRPQVRQLRGDLAFMAVDLPEAERLAVGIDETRRALLRKTLHHEGASEAADLLPGAVLERYAVVGDRAEVARRVEQIRWDVAPDLVVFSAFDYTAQHLADIAEIAAAAGLGRDPGGEGAGAPGSTRDERRP